MTTVNVQDARLKKSAGSGRDDRDSEDVRRQDNDGTAESVSERRKSFKSEWTQEALPTPPAIPGYHMCWLSTTNSYDPIQKRVRMGYTPVKVSDVAGFEHMNMQSGEFAGCISCNEMLLFKIPNDLYQEIMEEFHHNQPLEEEIRIKANAVQNQRDSNGKPLGMVEGDGFNDLGASVRTPNFV